MSGRDNVSGGGGMSWSWCGPQLVVTTLLPLAWFGGLQASEELPGFALSAVRKRTKLADSEFGGKNRLWLRSWLCFLLRVLLTVGEFQSLVPLVTQEQQHWVQTVRHERAIISFWLFGSLGAWEPGTLVLSYLVSVPGLGFVMGPARGLAPHVLNGLRADLGYSDRCLACGLG